jgi:hypothetical protein
MNDFPKNISGSKANLLLKFAEKLYRDLATVTEAPPLYVVYITMSFTVQTMV